MDSILKRTANPNQLYKYHSDPEKLSWLHSWMGANRVWKLSDVRDVARIFRLFFTCKVSHITVVSSDHFYHLFHDRVRLGIQFSKKFFISNMTEASKEWSELNWCGNENIERSKCSPNNIEATNAAYNNKSNWKKMSNDMTSSHRILSFAMTFLSLFIHVLRLKSSIKV